MANPTGKGLIPYKKGEGGRPPGVRNKFTEKFFEIFKNDFEKHGAATLERVRQEEPGTYMKIAAQLMPKHLANANGEPLSPSNVMINIIPNTGNPPEPPPIDITPEPAVILQPEVQEMLDAEDDDMA